MHQQQGCLLSNTAFITTSPFPCQPVHETAMPTHAISHASIALFTGVSCSNALCMQPCAPLARTSAPLHVMQTCASLPHACNAHPLHGMCLLSSLVSSQPRRSTQMQSMPPFPRCCPAAVNTCLGPSRPAALQLLGLCYCEAWRALHSLHPTHPMPSASNLILDSCIGCGVGYCCLITNGCGPLLLTFSMPLPTPLPLPLTAA